MIMLVAESRMVMGKAHVFHVGSLSDKISLQRGADKGIGKDCMVGLAYRKDSHLLRGFFQY